MKANNHPELNEELEKLLLTKKYHELTDAEKAWVDKKISAAEYADIRQSLLMTRAQFQQPSLKAAPHLRAQLMDKLRSKKTADKKPAVFSLSGLFQRQIPVWQAGIAAMLILLTGLFFSNNEKQMSTDPFYVYHTDTVFKEVYLPAQSTPIEDSVKSEQLTTNQSPKQIHARRRSMVADKKITGRTDSALSILAHADSVASSSSLTHSAEGTAGAGRSLSADRELMEFFGRLY